MLYKNAQGGRGMSEKGKYSIIHNAFYTRNTRKENLACLDGLPQGPDMDMYDYELDEEGALIKIHKKF